MARRPYPDTFPENVSTRVFNTALFFFQHVKDRFASDPAVYQELLRIFRGFSTGETPDPGKVAAEAYALLRGHPDLLRRLAAFLPEHAPEDPAPRRPKREQRRPTPAATVDDDPAVIRRILRYFKRVERANLHLYDKLLALILQLGTQKTLDGHEIYDLALEVFGSKDSHLLREFTEYLPVPTDRERDQFLKRRAKKEPPPDEHRAPAPKRKAAAVTADNPSAAKRPHADDRKATNRRAHSPAVVDAAPKSSGGVSAFREAWEFETTYTKLVATSRRIKELLKAYDPPEEDEPPRPPPTRGRRAFEELFPSRECQEVLREMYHGMLGPIREALEDGARTELALRTIKRRLRMLEQVAVKMAMERRDRARVEGRMEKLAVDRVLFLRKHQAKQSAGT